MFYVLVLNNRSLLQVKESGFSLTFVAKTQNETSQVTAKDEPMITRIHGPELAYVTSAICLVQCGLTLLREQDKMPERYA